ncbi:MAG TPA: alpha/beta fold hydrolase [Xanthobacteraceae bacterium]|jgi:poly(3-hydroxyalkanoate) synthetase|nr:alpha/beta fold hydrolase [Xanthobacteraceae bacterium]
MYDPKRYPLPNLAFLWPAIAAASAADMAAAFAKHFTNLALGDEGSPAPLPQWATPNRVTLDLNTVRLRDFTTAATAFPTLICAPFALHGAAMCDLAPGHSLVAALRDTGLRRLLVTDWHSATAEMRFLGIDDYLADLNVLIDTIGPPVDLIGLCQGGWLALIYAARFPKKIRKAVLAAAPIDIAAAPSAISALAESNPVAVFHELVRLGDGLVPGQKVLKFWGPQSIESEDVRQLLQSEEVAGCSALTDLEAVFRAWYAWTVDLPGIFFIETVERLYRRNEIASGDFVALGQKVDLKTFTAPLFLLAARDDELVAPAQLFATENLVGTSPHDLRKATAPCRHLGLFMGKRILLNAWSDVARWLAEPPHFRRTDLDATEGASG